jgi:2-iminobutanoate/2-iminopropanoate deaminase
LAIEKQVARFGPFKEYIADGVKVGNLLTLSGQVSVDDEANVVGAGDISLQVRHTYTHVQSVLAKFDATMDNIVDEMWLVTDMEVVMDNIDALFQMRAQAYGSTPEVSQTLIQVAGLVMPELMIEIKCIAHL